MQEYLENEMSPNFTNIEAGFGEPSSLKGLWRKSPSAKN